MGAIKQLPIEESAWFNKINTVGAIIVTRLCDAQNVFFSGRVRRVYVKEYTPPGVPVSERGGGGSDVRTRNEFPQLSVRRV